MERSILDMTSQHFSRPFVVALCCSSAAWLALPLSGCAGSGSASASAEASNEGDAEANFDAEGDAAWDPVDKTQEGSKPIDVNLPEGSAPGSVGAAGPPGSELLLLGARHDVSLKPGAPVPCLCLGVVLGQPGSNKIAWSGQQPRTNPQHQLVVVLGSEGVSCETSGPGASYMGHVKQGADIIVTVEAAVAGRPVTHGAIIPLPKEGGQVYIQPHGDIPYGRGLGGEARCALGNGK